MILNAYICPSQSIRNTLFANAGDWVCSRSSSSTIVLIGKFIDKQDGFPLLSDVQKIMLKTAINLGNYDQIVEGIKQVLVQTTGYLLEDDLAQFNNTILETDESFCSDQTFGTCIESSRTGPERQMASSNTRRMLKLYTLQKLVDRVWQYRNIDDVDKRDMLHLAEVRKIQLLSKITLP